MRTKKLKLKMFIVAIRRDKNRFFCKRGRYYLHGEIYENV